MMKEINDERSQIYKLGSIAAILSMVSIAFAIIAYFIWPYKGNTTSIEAIFEFLHSDRLGGLISLDVSMLIIGPIAILMYVAIYRALRRIDESYAIIALILNMIAICLVIVCRPLIELTKLSTQFALATDAIDKSRIISAGEVLRLQLDGTAWAIQTAFLMCAGLINGSLMLRSKDFSKRTAWIGIIVSAIGLPFFIHEVGMIFLFLNTLGSIPWCLFLARDLSRLAKEPKHPPKA